MDQWRDEAVRKHRAEGDEEQMEEEEEEEEAWRDGGNEEIDQSFLNVTCRAFEA